MAAEPNFKQKILKTLYGIGLKNMGESLLVDLKKGSPPWIDFVQDLLQTTDYPRRKLALKQLTGRGFVERHKQRAQLTNMLLEFLDSKDSIGEEKITAIKFVDKNLQLFSTDDDLFQSKIMSLQRDTDPKLSHLAGELLPKIGVDMDDRDLHRR